MTSNQPCPSVVLVSDEAALRVFLADNLLADGLEVDDFSDADTAWEALRFPDLLVLDARLPDRQALILLEHLRDPGRARGRVDARLPVLVLGAQSDLDRIRALDAGADDALACPFSYPELRSRARALLRRTQDRPRSRELRVGGLQIDASSHQVLLEGAPVELAAKEFALLRALASEPTRVFTKQELLGSLWGHRGRGTTRTLDTHACRLRGKLARAGGPWIINVWGVGYRLCDPAATA